MQRTYKISISGQVQGVGFRPYVFVLAKSFQLNGTVSNNEEGVIIYINGSPSNIQSFLSSLINDPPKVSRIDAHKFQEIEPREFDDFKIIPSERSGKLNLQLTPDFAICDECKTEISDKKNRRYYYPFTTCVNCGPRWAITNTFPFERDHTSIVKFNMCEACESEYKDPSNRRFHSQTNSCSKCGIQYGLEDLNGASQVSDKGDLFRKTSEILKDGKIVAIKNTGGYLLCCDASNPVVVQRLRQRKKRPLKPFAILYPNLEFLKKELAISEISEAALTSSISPIVIIPKTNYKGTLALNEIAPGLNQLGVMLPYTGMLQLLAKELGMPIVATSGNLHGSPIISSEEIAISELGEIADFFIHHDLDILYPQDDSVIKYSTKYNRKVLFRRSRGYAPTSFGNYPGKEKIMAMGGHLKSTVAFLPNDYLYISQYLGNLDNFDVYERFVETASKFTELFEQKPEVILVDKHPAYQSTQFGKDLAMKLGAKLYPVQHHEAHFTSVLGEHDLFNTEKAVLGVIWDGTGYGNDQQIWGGEFLKYEQNHIERISHFEYFDWLAADKMSKEPRLSLLALADNEMTELVSERFSEEELSIYKSIKKENTLKTSSVGRLFDATASLLNICHLNTYEGEAAILQENQCVSYNIAECKKYTSMQENGLLPSTLLIKEMYTDLKKGVATEQIIANFLFTLASMVFDVAERHSTNQIALSGGVFQNTVLIDMLIELAGTKYTLYFNRNLSPNDENISYGQIMHYLHINSEE